MSEMVEIIELSEIDEYYIKVTVNGLVLEAMISEAPYKIEVGKKYRANFSFTNFDDCRIKCSVSERKQLLHEKNYSYKASGFLINEDTVDVGITISSEFLEDNLYLVGHYIDFYIDRLELSFV